MTNEPKLTWHISEVTPEISRRATALQKEIKAVCAIEAEDEAALINYSYFLAATRKLEYPPNARPSVRNLSAFLERWKDCDRVEVWRFHEAEIPHKLKQVWNQAFDDAQELFESDPVEAPLSLLNEKDREEAETPGSPLQ